MSLNKYTDLNVMDLATSALLLVLYAVCLQIKYVAYRRSLIVDSINGTNYTDTTDPIKDSPTLSSGLFLAATTVYVVISYYQIFYVQEDPSSTERSIENSYRNFYAVILIICGSIINYQTAAMNQNGSQSSANTANINNQVPQQAFL